MSAEHQALVDAIAERRAQDAARVMSEHIDGSLGAGLAQDWRSAGAGGGEHRIVTVPAQRLPDPTGG